MLGEVEPSAIDSYSDHIATSGSRATSSRHGDIQQKRTDGACRSLRHRARAPEDEARAPEDEVRETGAGVPESGAGEARGNCLVVRASEGAGGQAPEEDKVKDK
eukprot:4230566-Amphidinium_carterae.1